ncbi:3-oxoacid CoA-transferase subunit B [Paracidovorax cattleyae]|uniref:3-oxoadipate CoA-transferase, beta subunit n=1 Tax=Paracidovorax cattleyae TaxID=80868 RepID=A0A1H0W9Q5_9BURK|nr:3-oxoacid CoA-transferase subunit B [Paracidovorax cattleyae]SDP87510.1 3-oxoadipate CoA-transferase, beta subunit [Paracidovorax cattleyae]
MTAAAFRPRTVAQIARRALVDIPDGAVVNLGIGQPMEIANHLPPDREIVIHCENGILGAGRLAVGGEVDDQLVNAGKQPITLVPGASLFHHGDSFTMIRGGHIDICVLGAFQVSARGDLANWRTLDSQAVPAVGGAMDLATGARQVFVMMELRSRAGASKLVERCTYPLTGMGVVDRIYTDLATFAIVPEGVQVLDRVDGLSHAQLEDIVGFGLR